MIHGEFKPQVSNISTMYSFNFDDEDAAFAARKDSMEIGHSNFHCYDKTSTPNSSEPHKLYSELND
jgi:hypothetical protein